MGSPCCGRTLGSLRGAFGPEDMQVLQRTIEEAEGRTKQKGLLASRGRKVDRRRQSKNISEGIIFSDTDARTSVNNWIKDKKKTNNALTELNRLFVSLTLGALNEFPNA